MALSRKTAGILLTILSAVLYGLYPSCARAVYADGGNEVFMMTLTTIMRTAGLYLFCLYMKQQIFQTRLHIRLGVQGGFFQALSALGIFSALNFLPGPVVLIIVFSHTILLMVYLMWRGDLKVEAGTIVTTVMALLGLTFVLDLWNQTTALSIPGFLFALMAALATLSRLYVYGEQTKIRSPAAVGTEAFVFSSLFLLLTFIYKLPAMPQSLEGIMWTIVGGVSMAVATVSMFYGIGLLGAFQFSLLLKLEPVFTSVFAAIILHEILAPHQYAGILLVIGSLVIYQLLEKRKKPLSAVAVTQEES